MRRIQYFVSVRNSRLAAATVLPGELLHTLRLAQPANSQNSEPISRPITASFAASPIFLQISLDLSITLGFTVGMDDVDGDQTRPPLRPQPHRAFVL